jgi:hypothetical protein
MAQRPRSDEEIARPAVDCLRETVAQVVRRDRPLDPGALRQGDESAVCRAGRDAGARLGREDRAGPPAAEVLPQQLRSLAGHEGFVHVAVLHSTEVQRPRLEVHVLHVEGDGRADAQPDPQQDLEERPVALLRRGGGELQGGDEPHLVALGERLRP